MATGGHSSWRCARGIGYEGTEGTIVNCYNLGILTGDGQKNYMIGTGTSGKDVNCYYLDGLETYTNCAVDTNTVAFTKETSQEVVDSLNAYIDAHIGDETLDTSNWKKWKVGEDGYPTFAE